VLSAYGRLLCCGIATGTAVGSGAGDVVAVFTGGDWFAVVVFGFPLGLMYGAVFGLATTVAVALMHRLLQRGVSTMGLRSRRLTVAGVGACGGGLLTALMLHPFAWWAPVTALVALATFWTARAAVAMTDRVQGQASDAAGAATP
jgi:hypothetical protein